MILLLLLFIIILPTKQRKTRRFFFVFLLCFVCFVIFVCVLILRVFLWCQYPSLIPSKCSEREEESCEVQKPIRERSAIRWLCDIRFGNFNLALKYYFFKITKMYWYGYSMLCDHGSWFMTAGRWDQLSSCTPKLLKNQKKKKSTNQRHQPRLLQIACLLTLQNKQKFLWNCHQVPKCIASIKIALLPHAFVPNESSSSALNITHSKLVYCCSHWILSPNDR